MLIIRLVVLSIVLSGSYQLESSFDPSLTGSMHWSCAIASTGSTPVVSGVAGPSAGYVGQAPMSSLTSPILNPVVELGLPATHEAADTVRIGASIADNDQRVVSDEEALLQYQNQVVICERLRRLKERGVLPALTCAMLKVTCEPRPGAKPNVVISADAFLAIIDKYEDLNHAYQLGKNAEDDLLTQIELLKRSAAVSEELANERKAHTESLHAVVAARNAAITSLKTENALQKRDTAYQLTEKDSVIALKQREIEQAAKDKDSLTQRINQLATQTSALLAELHRRESLQMVYAVMPIAVPRQQPLSGGHSSGMPHVPNFNVPYGG